MVHPIEYVFQTRTNPRNNESKTFKKIYHQNVNVNVIAENVIQIISGITVNIDVIKKIRKNIMSVKNITFGILVNVLAKMVNI